MDFLVKWIKFSVKKQNVKKNTGKMAKNTGKVREFCQSGKVGTLWKEGVEGMKEWGWVGSGRKGRQGMNE